MRVAVTDMVAVRQALCLKGRALMNLERGPAALKAYQAAVDAITDDDATPRSAPASARDMPSQPARVVPTNQPTSEAPGR